MKHLFLILLLSLGIYQLQAQDSREKDDKKQEKRERIKARLKLEEEMDPAFKKYNIFGAQAASDGYGFFFEKGFNKTPKKAVWFRAELNERKHPKEKKITGINIGTGQINSLFYGKTINFYQFKLGAGIHQLIGGKANKNGIAVSALYGGGIIVGLAKPYLVDAQDSNRQIDRLPFETFYANPNKYGQYPIGSAGFTAGWNQLKVRPGVHAKAAMRFDNSRFNETIFGIEAGLNVEYYFTKIRQMVEVQPKTLFFNAYVAVGLGRRK